MRWYWIVAFVLWTSCALAQPAVRPCISGTGGSCTNVDASNPLPVTVGGSSGGVVSQGAVTTSAPTYTTGTNQSLSLDTAGGLRVSGNIAVGTAGSPSADVLSTQGVTGMTPLTVGMTYPPGAAAITISNTGTTASVAATLAGTSGKTTYICGFSMTATATAGTAGAATIANTVTGTLNFVQPVGALTADVGVLAQTFTPCIPASAVNTGIVLTTFAAGSGGIAAVTAWGFQL